MSEIVTELFALVGIEVDQKSWAKGNAFFEKVSSGLQMVAGAFALNEIKEAFMGVSELADHAVKAGQKLGITTEAIQELGYAAKLSDVSQEGLETALGKLAVNLDTVAKTGKGPAADALKRLGLHAKDFKGLSLDESFMKISDSISEMADGPAKAAVSVALLGKQGKELIPLLNEGADGLAEMRLEAQEMGIVISNTDAKKYEELNDNITRIGAEFQGVKVKISNILLPYIAKAADYILHLVDTITHHEDAIKVALIGIGIAAAAAAAPIILAAAPFVALAAAVAGVAYAMEHWETIGTKVKVALYVMFGPFILVLHQIIKHFDSIKEAAIAAYDWIADKAQWLADNLEDIWGGIKAGAKAAWDTVGAMIVLPFAVAFGAIRAAGEAIFDFIQGGVDSLKKAVDWIYNKYKDVKEFVIGSEEDQKNADFALNKAFGIGSAASSPSGGMNIFDPATFAPFLAQQSDAGMTQTNKIDISVTAAPGADGDDIGAQIAKYVQDVLNNARDAAPRSPRRA